MADYDSAPQVQDTGTIELYGHIYKLFPDQSIFGQGQLGMTREGAVKVFTSTELPPKLITGDYSETTNPSISTYTIRDLRGGMGLWQYGSSPDDLHRYWSGSNINTFWPGAITLGPLATSVSIPGGASATSVAMKTGFLSGTFVVAFDTKVYNYTGAGWSAQVATLPATVAMSKVTNFAGRLFYPLTAAGYSYQSAAAGATTDVATPLFAAFCVWGKNIYGIDTSWQLWTSTTGNAASWGAGLASIPISGAYGGTQMVDMTVAPDENGTPVIWANTNAGLWMYDSTNDVWRRPSMAGRIYYIGTQIPSKSLTIFNSDLYAISGTHGIMRIKAANGGFVAERFDVGYPDGLANSQPMAITEIVSDDNLIFAYEGPSTSTPFGSYIYASQGLGWCPIYATSSNTVGNMGMMINDNALGFNLVFCENVTATAADVKYIVLSEFEKNPLHTTATTYAASGNITLPVFSANYPARTKLALQVRVKLAKAPTTSEAVAIWYRKDGSLGAFTQVGSAVNTTSETTIRLGTNNVGIAFKSWQWYFGLTRGATTTNAPAIEYVALDYVHVPDVWKGFIVQVDCREVSPEGLTAREQVDNLWTAIGTSTLGTFSYRDDSGNTRSYLVKVGRPEGIENTGIDEQGVYTLYLTSYGAN